MTVLGAILAGGQSQRFGSDKALALWDGRALIDHVAAMLRPSVDALVICGRAAHPGDVVCIADWPAPDMGPLGGLCAALRQARSHGHAAVLTVGCDTPVLPDDLPARLMATGASLYVADMPIIGYWRADLADGLADHLTHSEDRSVRRWARAMRVAAIGAGGPVPNLNSPADLAMLRAARR